MKITGKMDYKRPKLTPSQKALKAVLKPIALDTKRNIKASVIQRTGALRLSIDYKIVSRNGTAAAIIGVRSKYGKMVQGKLQIPNLYALKIDQQYGFLKQFINASLTTRLVTAWKSKLKELGISD